MNESQASFSAQFKRWHSIGFGVYLIGASLLMAVGVVIAGWLIGNIAHQVEDPNPTAALLLKQPLLLALTALPSLALGVVALKAKRKSLLIVIVGSFVLLVPIALLLYCLVALLAPMYEYDPI